jgi:hypothetical protein
MEHSPFRPMGRKCAPQHLEPPHTRPYACGCIKTATSQQPRLGNSRNGVK